MSTKCYTCGQAGHWKRNCPQRRSTNAGQTGNPGGNTCQRCDKFGHRASECRSKFKKDGTQLPGNRSSRAWDAAKKYPMVASSNATQTQEGVQESIWPWQNQ
uniref:CCHC-type domain-containing protein n=1 Tax=Apteryx owenii TaxID=8824 RepID=A0A8B9P7C2_APTOW